MFLPLTPQADAPTPPADESQIAWIALPVITPADDFLFMVIALAAAS